MLYITKNNFEKHYFLVFTLGVATSSKEIATGYVVHIKVVVRKLSDIKWEWYFCQLVVVLLLHRYRPEYGFGLILPQMVFQVFFVYFLVNNIKTPSQNETFHFWYWVNKEYWSHLNMIFRGRMFCKIITLIFTPWYPKNTEVFLTNRISSPIEAHIHLPQCFCWMWWFIIKVDPELLVCTSVSGCGCPISSKLSWRRVPILVFSNSAPFSDSVAEDITFLMMR